MNASQNPPPYRIDEIQYLPHHHCPRCGAAARTTPSGAWLEPYQDWFGTALRYWQDHLGYVRFECRCQHHPEFKEGLRVARLGDAILPLNFVNTAAAARIGKPPAEINAERTRLAVAFLAEHANPEFSGSVDWLAHTLHALAAGGLSPEAARKQLQAWIEYQERARPAGGVR